MPFIVLNKIVIRALTIGLKINAIIAIGSIVFPSELKEPPQTIIVTPAKEIKRQILSITSNLSLRKK